MELREQILDYTYRKMIRIGVQSMTMDMVARGCGISKRTLYEKFSDKETLIISALEHKDKMTHASFDEIVRNASNSFSALLGVFKVIRNDIQNTSEVFLTDAQRLYPKIFNRHKVIESSHVEWFVNMIRKAQSEGLALKEIDPEIASVVLFSAFSGFHNNDNLFIKNYSRVQLLDGVFLNFMRGISTEEGRRLIHEQIKDLKNFTSSVSNE